MKRGPKIPIDEIPILKNGKEEKSVYSFRRQCFFIRTGAEHHKKAILSGGPKTWIVHGKEKKFDPKEMVEPIIT